MNTYDVADYVRVTGLFEVADVATDPTTVVVKYKDPSGNTTTKAFGVDGEVVKVSTGLYRLDIPIDEPGTWYYRWVGTGAAPAGEDNAFMIRTTVFV